MYIRIINMFVTVDLVDVFGRYQFEQNSQNRVLFVQRIETGVYEDQIM